jgi:hypothetical protein
MYIPSMQQRTNCQAQDRTDRAFVQQDLDLFRPIKINLTSMGMIGLMYDAGVIVPGLLSSLGSRGFTTLTNFTNFLACMVWGGIPLGARMWCGKRRLF